MKLVIRDLVGEATTRLTHAATCERAKHAVALFIATALDERPSLFIIPSSEPEVPSPEAEPARAERTARPGRRGSGGLAVDLFYSWGPTRGIHAYGASLVGSSMRVGGAFTASTGSFTDGKAKVSPEQAIVMPIVPPLYEGTRTLQTAALLVGWGAPWNDCVAGFIAELGGVLGSDTFKQHGDPPAKRPHQSSYLAPYISWSLILQIPWKFPMRPIVGLSGALMPGMPRAPNLFMTTSIHGGLVWQTW